MFSKTKLLLLGSVAFCGNSLQGAYAQTDDSLEFEEIVVMGEKRGKTLFDTYSSVAVVTAQEIEKRSLESLSDVFDQLANVSSRNSGEGFSIRGISNTSNTGAGSGPLASIYMDGAALSGPAIRYGQTNTWDIAQVEVFRGAQSTNQGRNALAGVVIMRSTDPSYEFEGKARLSYSEYDSYGISGAINLPISDGQAAVRLGVDLRNSDGFINNTFLNDDRYGKNKTSLYRGKLLLEPAGIEGLRNIFTVSYSETRRGDDFVHSADPFTRETTANILGHRNLDQFIATWEADYEINETWSFRNVLSYNSAEQSRLRDDDRTSGGGDNRRADTSDVDTFSEEFRLHYDGERLSGFIGGFYLKEDLDSTNFISSGISVPDFVPAQFQALVAPFYAEPFPLLRNSSSTEETANYAFFMNVDFEVSEKVTLHGGLRYDHEKQEVDALQVTTLGADLPDLSTVPAPLQPLIAPLNAGLTALAGTIDEPLVPATFSAWLPQFGATVRWSDKVSTSLLAKRGYRAGGSALIVGPDPVAEFDPEYVWTYEASIKTKLMDGQATLNATVFHMDWTDQQVLVRETIGGIPQNVPQNAGESDLDGFEVELTVQATENFDFYASAGYTNSEFVSFNGLLGDFEGNQFAHAPKWNLVAGGTYRNDNGLFAHADVNYQSLAYGDVANTDELDSRTLVNAKIGYEAERFAVYAYARNLFDAEYIALINVTGARKVGDPQMFGIELHTNF